MRPHPRYTSPGLEVGRTVIEPGDAIHTVGTYTRENIKRAWRLLGQCHAVRISTKTMTQDGHALNVLVVQDADSYADAVLVAPLEIVPEESEVGEMMG